MKRNWGIISLLCLLCLLLLTNQVYASQPGLSTLKKTPEPASNQGQPGNENNKEKENNGKSESNANANSKSKTEKENNGKSEAKDCAEDQTASNSAQDGTEKVKCNASETEKPEKDNPGQKKLLIRGTLVAIGENSITIQVGEETQTFTIGDATRLKIPTLGNASQWDKLNKGVTILLKAVQQDDNSLLAVDVRVIPSQPERVHHVGVISSYSTGESITVDGVTYKITADTVVLPNGAEIKAGDKVTIISPRDVTGGELVAKGIVIRQK